MVLLGEAFYDSGESLNLSLESGGAWFVSLNIVGRGNEVTSAVNGESIQWTKSLRSLDTRPLRRSSIPSSFASL